MQSRTTQARIQRLSSDIQQAEAREDLPRQVSLYKELAKLAPGTTLVHAKISHLLHTLGDDEAAQPHVMQALALPYDPASDQMLFEHLCKLPRYTEQADQARSWYKARPTLTRFKLLHEALTHLNADEELEGTIHELLQTRLHPSEQSQLMTLLAQIYHRQARFHDCIACYQVGLELTPGNPTQMLNLASANEHLGRYNEALSLYEELLKIDPQHINGHHNLGILMLRLGEFELGWKQHEWRWLALQKEQQHHFAIPRWEGQPLAGKTLLVWAEQGIGDHVMYANMFDDLRKTGAELHIEIYARLDGLFKQSFPYINFLRRELLGEDNVGDQKVFKQSWPKADYQIPIGSLGSVLRTSRESFGTGTPYLTANSELIDYYTNKYATLFPAKRLIGLSWRGGKASFTRRQGRNTSPEELACLSQLSDVQFVDLQYDSNPEDVASFHAAGLSIYHDDEVDPTGMLDAQAAQLMALDAVITIDNTTVHLAGALGVPTYALIQLNPDWRWGVKSSDSLWYQSVRLYRNSTTADWKGPLQQIIKELSRD